MAGIDGNVTNEEFKEEVARYECVYNRIVIVRISKTKTKESNIEYSTYPVSKFHRKKVKVQRKRSEQAQRNTKDQPQRRAQIGCSQARKFVTWLSNGTSFLAVTYPCKIQAGWPFWCSYRNVDYFSI